MNKTIEKLFIVTICLFILSSCEDDWYLQANYYVDNNTNNEYLICLDYNFDMLTIKDQICCVLPNKSKQIIDSNLWQGHSEDDIGTIPFYIWVYNRKDSTYIKVSSENHVSGLLSPSPIESKTRKTNQTRPTKLVDFYITINDSLVSKMTKNTHLTDSVFGLKK